MRETVEDWKNDWIGANGITNELEVVIEDSGLEVFHTYAYEGCFANIPTELLGRKVIKYGKIVESTVPERNGAYSLKI